MVPLVPVAGGYGWYLLQTLLALAAVCLLAILALRYGLRRVATLGGGDAGRIRLLERVAVDARRSLVLIEVAGRILLVGAGEGPMTLIAEIDPGTLPPLPERRRVAFREVLARAMGRPQG